MKLYKITFVVLFISTILFAQNFENITEIKQITDFNYECKNPSFNLDYYYSIIKPFFTFESHKDSTSEIAIMTYDSWNDKFDEPFFISNNGAKNINPIAIAVSDPYFQQIILWETDINGNFDIVYKEVIENDGTNFKFGEMKFLTETLADEKSVSFFDGQNYLENKKFEIVYERNGEILYYSETDSSKVEEVIFPAINSATIYKQPTGTNYFSLNFSKGKAIACVEKSFIDSSSRIVYKYKFDSDSTWSEIMEMYSSTNCKNPKFFKSSSHEPNITFEAEINGLTKILYYTNAVEFGQDSLATIYYQSGETSDFSSYLAYTGIINSKAFMSVPNSAKLNRNDSTFILLPKDDSRYDNLEAIPIKYNDSKHNTGYLGNLTTRTITFTIWEDSSSNGIINLFGRGRLEISVDVEDEEALPTVFKLEQNYPNPFNPSTTINYSVPNEVDTKYASTTNVVLKVYDVLGREVATLLNKEQAPGSYSVKFDGSILSSGLYLYRLQIGSFVSTKKMILMK